MESLEQIIPAHGWMAIFEDISHMPERLVCWALVVDSEASETPVRRVVGMVARGSEVHRADKLSSFRGYEYHQD